VSSAPDLTSRILRHERALVASTIAALVAVCWWYVATEAETARLMRAAPVGVPPMGVPPVGALTIMWLLMMVAMMLPSTAPAVLLYSRVRNIKGRDSTIVRSWVFLLGYLAVWLLFSIAAAFAQKLLTGPSMALDNRFVGGAVLIVAGLYQLSPVKSACIRQCRSPGQFLSRYWQPGWAGAVQLGLRHGTYCLGCCWMLMALLFVGGIMNILWIAGLTMLVAAEKLLRSGQLISRVSGAALVLWGTVTVFA
jgi:predicted metal-binding membrane protein